MKGILRIHHCEKRLKTGPQSIGGMPVSPRLQQTQPRVNERAIKDETAMRDTLIDILKGSFTESVPRAFTEFGDVFA